MHIPYLSDIQANYVTGLAVCVVVYCVIRIIHKEFFLELRKKNWLPEAAEKDKCTEVEIFRKAAKQYGIPAGRHKILDDYVKYTMSGDRGMYPRYVRDYLRNRFKK